MEPFAGSRGRSREVVGLLMALGLCFAVAGLGGYWTSMGLDDWYPGLRKPSWKPPNAIFGPVWTLLYTAMAVAAWLVWHQAGFVAGRVPLALFGVQLLLNLAWSGLFFGLRRPDLAFYEIVLLWGMILATLTTSWKVSRIAGVLLLPYLLWVGFATALNFAIWRLNA
jgi:translocator protein